MSETEESQTHSNAGRRGWRCRIQWRKMWNIQRSIKINEEFHSEKTGESLPSVATAAWTLAFVRRTDWSSILFSDYKSLMLSYTKLVFHNYLWPDMNRGTRTWTKAGIQCQMGQIHQLVYLYAFQMHKNDDFSLISISLPLIFCHHWMTAGSFQYVLTVSLMAASINNESSDRAPHHYLPTPLILTESFLVLFVSHLTKLTQSATDTLCTLREGTIADSTLRPEVIIPICVSMFVAQPKALPED